MFVPPYTLLLTTLGIDGEAMTTAERVTIPASLFRHLLQIAASASPLDEAAYLAANADVAGSVAAGGFASARAHYTYVGYFEGRTGGTAGFDADWYRDTYPDVPREAPAASQHYHAVGAAEWRAPNEAARSAVIGWRVALHRDPVRGEAHAGDPAPPPSPPTRAPAPERGFWSRLRGEG